MTIKYDQLHGDVPPGKGKTWTYTLSADTRFLRWWLRVAGASARIIGPERAWRLAYWGAMRLVRVKFGDGPWHFMRLDDL